MRLALIGVIAAFGVFAQNPPSGGGSATVTCNATMTSNVAVCSGSAAIPRVSLYGTSTTGYISGYLTVSAANTGAWTLQVGSGSAVSVLTATGGTPSANQVVSGTVYPFSYNGTNFIVGIAGVTGGAFGPLVTYSSSHVMTSGDCGSPIVMTGGSTFTLLNPAPANTCIIAVQNSSGGSLTISRNGLLINNAAADMTLAYSATNPFGVYIKSDGTNYWIDTGAQGPTGPTGATGSTGPAGPSQRAWSFVFSNGGSALTSGQLSGTFTSPISCTLNFWDIDTQVNNAPGADTATVKTYKIASGTTSPGVGNSISTSGVSISTGSHVHSTTMTDFTTQAVSQYDVLAFDLSAVGGTATQVTFTLGCQ